MTEGLPTDGPTPETRPTDVTAAEIPTEVAPASADAVESATAESPATEPTPDAGTTEPSAVLTAADVAEISETERGLESLAEKLAKLRETTYAKQTEIADQLTALIAEITQLQDSLPNLRSAVELAAADVASDQGASDALESFAAELEGGDEGGGIAELKKLIEAEQQLILDAGKKLVGDADPAYLAEFLDETRNPDLTINMDRAGGISFEIKNTLVPKLEAANRNLSVVRQTLAQQGKFSSTEPQIELAEKNVRDADFDLNQAGNEAQRLGEQIRRSRATIRELRTSVEKAQKLPGTMHEKAQSITQDRAHTSALDVTNDILAAAEKNLGDARSKKADLDSVIEFCIDLINRIDQLADQISHAIATLNRAEELLSQVPDFTQRLTDLEPEFQQISGEATQGIDGKLVSVGMAIMQTHVAIVATCAARTEAAKDLLQRGAERLNALREVLEHKVIGADSGADDKFGSQYFTSVQEALDAATDLERFIDNEWPEIEAGDAEGIAAICTETKTCVAKSALILSELTAAQLHILAPIYPEAAGKIKPIMGPHAAETLLGVSKGKPQQPPRRRRTTSKD